MEEENDGNIIEKYSKKDALTNLSTKLQSNQNNELTSFFSHCKSIYECYEEIDTTTQAAALILFENVLNKYEQHSSELACINSLLSSTLAGSASESSNKEIRTLSAKRPSSTSQELLEKLPLKHRATAKEILTQIAFNFFEDVSEGKVSLENLSLRFQLPVEELRSNYYQYLQQSTEIH